MATTNEGKTKLESKAPYVPFPTFVTFIETLKSSTVPPVVDSSILPKMSGTARSHLMVALRFLGLVDQQGTVREPLRALVKAYKSDIWQQELSDLVFQAYLPIVGDLDLDSGTAAQLSDAFRQRGNVDGQVLDKAIRFWLAAVRESGTTVSPHFANRRSTTAGRKNGKGRQKKEQVVASEEGPDPKPFAAPGGMAQFKLPVPGKPESVIYLPVDLDLEDWEMLKVQLDAYVNRLIKRR